MRSLKMRPENEVGILSNEGFVTVHGLADAPGRVPMRHLARIHAQARCLLTSCSFGKSDGSDRRQGEGDARDAAIIRPVAVAFQHIGTNDLAVVARYRRPRRTPGRRVSPRADCY